MKFIRGYRVMYCHKHEEFNQGFRKFCFICGTDLYNSRIARKV